MFYRIWTEYGDLFDKSPYSVRMRENENMDQKNSKYGHFLRSDVVKLSLNNGYKKGLTLK